MKYYSHRELKILEDKDKSTAAKHLYNRPI